MGNKFIPLPTLLPGVEGVQPSIDLVTLAPPTGLDPHLTFICAGNFLGKVGIEGSIDNVGWSALVQFEAGFDLDGQEGPALEFSPLVTDATVRYLRLNVVGRIVETTFVTVAGVENTAGPSPEIVDANCLPGDAVGNLVYVTGPAVAGKYQVATIDPLDPNKMPAVGIIISKSSPTDCVLQLEGFVSGIYGGLSPGKIYWAGGGGTPVLVPPISPPNVLQSVGVAFDTGIFYLHPDFQLVSSGGGGVPLGDFRDNIRLAGAVDGINRIFTTPDKFEHLIGGVSINVYHNGRKLTESPTRNPEEGDFFAFESGGIGTGFDSIEILSFVPVSNSILTADYIAV